MGVVRCGKHGCKCCWGCDRCPKCHPETGKLRKGDYCADCVAKFKAKHYIWSEYFMNWVEPETVEALNKRLAEEKAWKEAHASDYLVLAAFGAWHRDVPKDYVGVFAGKGGRTPEGHYPADTKWFVVPQKDYKPNMILNDYPEIEPLEG